MGIRWFAVQPEAVIESLTGGAVARMLDGDGAGLDCGMTQRVRNERCDRIRQSRPLSGVADEERTQRWSDRCR